jgi:DNA-binding NarL/FixJ family response regulator
MDKTIKILVVDDHPIFRKGMLEVLASDDSLEVVGEAADGAEALKLAEKLQPDIAVLDLDLPQIPGLELIRSLQKMRHPVDTVVLTMSKSEQMFNEAIDRGAKGYVLKDDAVHDLLQSLRAVAAGKPYVSPSLSGSLLRRGDRTRELHDKKPSLASLTPMERRVLSLISQNQTTREIAASLFVSPYTIETHRCNICKKLSLEGAQPVLRFALEHKSELGGG